MTIDPDPNMQRSSPPVEFVVLLGAILLLALYFILRYRGFWGEGDTSVFSVYIHAMAAEGRLTPRGPTYPNGYAYQSLAVWLMQTANLGIPSLQRYAASLLVVWIVFPAWLLYRAFIGSQRGALWATTFLFVQPEFLFPVLRGTHEKFTRGLMLICLYLLLRSLRSHRDPGRFASWVLSFYLAVYALIAFNNLLATSFILGIALALLIVWGITRLTGDEDGSLHLVLHRLVYAVVISLVLGFLFLFYIYRPAHHDLRVLQSIGNRIAALFLDVEAVPQNPYTAIQFGWLSLPVYLAVSLANWLLLATSALLWLGQSVRWLLGRWRPADERALLLWAFYAAFAVIVAISIVADVSGAIGGNLQLRNFPTFTLLAAPLVAHWLVNARGRVGQAQVLARGRPVRFPPRSSGAHGARIGPVRLQPRPPWSRRLTTIAVGAGIAGLALLSTLKATNEPLLSNKWQFYTSGEIMAIEWMGASSVTQSLWVGYDERLHTGFVIRSGGVYPQVPIDHAQVDANTRDFLISEIIRARSARLAQPLPVAAHSLVTYDNGQVQVYHSRPRTSSR